MLVHINSDTHRRAVNTTAVLPAVLYSELRPWIGESEFTRRIDQFVHARTQASKDRHARQSAFQRVPVRIFRAGCIQSSIHETRYDTIRYSDAYIYVYTKDKDRSLNFRTHPAHRRGSQQPRARSSHQGLIESMQHVLCDTYVSTCTPPTHTKVNTVLVLVLVLVERVDFSQANTVLAERVEHQHYMFVRLSLDQIFPKTHCSESESESKIGIGNRNRRSELEIGIGNRNWKSESRSEIGIGIGNLNLPVLEKSNAKKWSHPPPSDLDDTYRDLVRPLRPFYVCPICASYTYVLYLRPFSATQMTLDSTPPPGSRPPTHQRIERERPSCPSL